MISDRLLDGDSKPEKDLKKNSEKLEDTRMAKKNYQAKSLVMTLRFADRVSFFPFLPFIPGAFLVLTKQSGAAI